jgi:MFS family permease
MKGFFIFWSGQFVSLMASAMVGFAMPIWAYEKTSSPTALAWMGLFFVTPMLVISPIAGVLVDRHNRKLMMMLSDLAAGLATIVILILYSQGKLEIWHLYLTNAFQGFFNAFQWPAFSAAISTMLPKGQYGRANGMMSLLDMAPGIFAPMLAAALIGGIGIEGILMIDVITFLFAIGALLVIHVPQPKATLEGQQGQGNLLKEAAYGFRYILARPSLLGLQLIFLTGNFFHGTAAAVQAPYILEKTNSNPTAFGLVNTLGAVGGLLGGMIMSVWGGPRRRVHGVLGGWFASSLVGFVLLGVGRSLPVWLVAVFLGSLLIPIINGSNQAIWQSKVAPDLQGRVFSIRRLIAWFVSPLAMFISGPLAEFVLEPAMQADGALAPVFSWLVGVGPGSGMALMFIFCGLAASLVGLGGYAFTVVRQAETLLPDHDHLQLAEQPASPTAS